MTFFEVMLKYCFFENNDDPAKVAAEVLKPVPFEGAMPDMNDSIIRTDKSLQFRSPNDLHEMFIDRLQYFIDSLSLLGERHIKLFNNLIFSPKFKTTLFSLLNKGETNLRLKCHEILEIIGTYFIQYQSQKSVYQLETPQSRSEVERMEVDFITCERLYIA